jgi:hypothetical protein
LTKAQEIEASSQLTTDDAINILLLKHELQAFWSGTHGDGPHGFVLHFFFRGIVVYGSPYFINVEICHLVLTVKIIGV